MLSKNDPSVVIRKYEPRDRPAVRRICCETALMGEPSAVFFDDYEVFADALTSYFTDYEPESCFVAEYDNNVIGYLIGSKDVKRMEKIFARKIALTLFAKALCRGVFFRKNNLKFLAHVIFSLIKGEFRTPDFSGDYPATLHINVAKGCRVIGIGSKLIAIYTDYLKVQAVKGVYLSTMSDKAGRFFDKLNFRLLFSGERSYFRYFLGHNVPLYIYGMQLFVRTGQ